MITLSYDVLNLILSKMSIEYKYILSLSDKNFYKIINKSYNSQIIKYLVNKNYLCVICKKKTLRDSVVILCNCMNNYSSMHLNCLEGKFINSSQISTCPICNKRVQFIRTNSKSKN